MSIPTQQPKVLIIGAGPTGMTAALELSRMGIPIRIVERMSQPAATSRAIGVQGPHTLRAFRTTRASSRPCSKREIAVSAAVSTARASASFDLTSRINGSDYGYILLISQAETEKNLRTGARAARRSLSSATWSSSRSRRPDDVVSATLKHPDGSLEQVQTAYLIDSEGAHSVGRRVLNLPFSGKTREETYALGDTLPRRGFTRQRLCHLFLRAWLVGPCSQWAIGISA